MTLNAIFYVFAAVLYLAAAFGIYKTLQEPEPTEKFWIRPLICAGLMIQAYLIYEALFLYGTPHFGMALALTITLFTCTFLLLLESFFSKIGAMLVFVLPLSAVSMLLPLLLPGSPLAPETASGPFRLHLLLAILAYSVMTMALIQGLLLMAVHKRVRAKDFVTHEGAKHVNILDNMPSMMEMEKILFRLIWVGFIVLTAAILSILRNFSAKPSVLTTRLSPPAWPGSSSESCFSDIISEAGEESLPLFGPLSASAF